MYKPELENDLRKLINELQPLLDHTQVDQVPDCEPKKRCEQLYVLDRVVRLLDAQPSRGNDRTRNQYYQAAKHVLGRD